MGFHRMWLCCKNFQKTDKKSKLNYFFFQASATTKETTTTKAITTTKAPTTTKATTTTKKPKPTRKGKK